MNIVILDTLTYTSFNSVNSFKKLHNLYIFLVRNATKNSNIVPKAAITI